MELNVQLPSAITGPKLLSFTFGNNVNVLCLTSLYYVWRGRRCQGVRHLYEDAKQPIMTS